MEKKFKCEICEKREGVLDYSESVIDYTHGFKRNICRECYIEILKKQLVKIKSGLKEQKELLKKEKMEKKNG